MNPLALVFDVGGTNLRAGAYSIPEGCLVCSAETTVPEGVRLLNEDHRSVRGLFDLLGSLAQVVLAGDEPALVVLAFPGPMDSDGNAWAAPTIWGRTLSSKTLPIRDLLQGQWPGTSVFVLNDVTAAGFRYLSHPNETLCVITVSSGIGHKVFVDGTPIVGPNGRGGEIGHLRVDFSPEAPVCDCGYRGHLGAVASGRASRHHVIQLARKNPEEFKRSLLASLTDGCASTVQNEHLVSAYRQGDSWTERVVLRMADPLGMAISAIHLAVGVERFILVGGFALALGGCYRRQVAEAAARNTWDLGVDWDRAIELGQDGEDAGLLGAGAYAAMQQALDVKRCGNRLTA